MKRTATYSLVLGIFFLCGFCTTLNSVLIPYLRDALDMSYAALTGVQVAFFLAYFMVSPLAGRIFHERGQVPGMHWGLALSALGALIFAACGWDLRFALVLSAAFVLGAGIAVLQVTINPFAQEMGPPESASSRLCLCQAFTSMGMLFAPWFGAETLLAEADLGGTASASAMTFPYGLVTLAWVVLFLGSQGLPVKPIVAEHEDLGAVSPWSDPVLLLGMLGIGLSVGIETAVGSFLIPLLSLEHIGALSLERAGELTMIFWGGLMVGRVIGGFLLKFLRAESLLAAHATAGLLCALLACLGTGTIAGAAALGLGLCISVMFPTIFSLVLGNSRCGASVAAGCLCMANVGGAILPFLQGLVSDQRGIQAGFFIPVLCFTLLTGCSFYIYGVYRNRLKNQLDSCSFAP